MTEKEKKFLHGCDGLYVTAVNPEIEALKKRVAALEEQMQPQMVSHKGTLIVSVPAPKAKSIIASFLRDLEADDIVAE